MRNRMDKKLQANLRDKLFEAVPCNIAIIDKDFEIIDHNPQLLGIGLDENTGILVHYDRFEVVGNHYVAIIDGTRWSRERDTIYHLPKNTKEFYFLKPGDEYDLRMRKVLIDKEIN